MRGNEWIAAALVGLVAGGWVVGGEPSGGEPALAARWAVVVTGAPPEQGRSWLHRLGPAGGWHPYGGGLLHWWNPSWRPRCGAPDDYDRKPLPTLTCSPYSHYSVLDLRGHGCPDNKGP
jgi:hypothetical protein